MADDEDRAFLIKNSNLFAAMHDANSNEIFNLGAHKQEKKEPTAWIIERDKLIEARNAEVANLETDMKYLKGIMDARLDFAFLKGNAEPMMKEIFESEKFALTVSFYAYMIKKLAETYENHPSLIRWELCIAYQTLLSGSMGDFLKNSFAELMLTKEETRDFTEALAQEDWKRCARCYNTRNEKIFPLVRIRLINLRDSEFYLNFVTQLKSVLPSQVNVSFLQSSEEEKGIIVFDLPVIRCEKLADFQDDRPGVLVFVTGDLGRHKVKGIIWKTMDLEVSKQRFLYWFQGKIAKFIFLPEVFL